MSTGKRIAKRSIIGTRVVAPGIDGRFYPATIQSTKQYDTYHHGPDANRYLVRFDNSRKVCEFGETELVGPGFAGVSAIGMLMTGQRVYLTHGGREMEGTVLHHDERADIVTVNLASGEHVTVRRDEIRLLESRKSNRLLVRQTSASDLNKSSDFSIFQDRSKQGQRRRLNSEISSNSDSSEIFGSRKRRGSETVSEEGGSSSEESLKRVSSSRRRNMRLREGGDEKRTLTSSPIMSECTAAMVLMDLYGSPMNRSSHISGQSEGGSSGQMSPSSSGVSSLGSSWNSPAPLTPPGFSSSSLAASDSPVSALLELSGDYGLEKQHSDSDEGIVSDQSCEFEQKRKKTEGLKTIYQCTWRSCTHQETQSRQEMERHVRHEHLGLPGEPGDDEEGEEEFYYTEFELPPAAEFTDLTSVTSLSVGGSLSRGGLSVPELRTPVPCGGDESATEEDTDTSSHGPVEREDCSTAVLQVQVGSAAGAQPSAAHYHRQYQQQLNHNNGDNGLDLVKVTAINHMNHSTPTTQRISASSYPTPNPSTSTVLAAYNNHIMTTSRPPLLPPTSTITTLPHHHGGLAKIPMGATTNVAVTSATSFYAVPASQQPIFASNGGQHHMHTAPKQPQPLLADHFDMARPPHENPEYSQQTGCTRILTSTATPTYATIISPPTTIGGLPIAIPITTFTISNGGGANGGQATAAGFPGKYIRLSPKPTSNPTLISSSPKSPVRRPRGDAKKCRKVYGMDQKDLWCTQCKWKKACTRFGESHPM